MITDSCGQLRELADDVFDDKINYLNRELEGGIKDQLMYWKKVGMLEAYRMAKQILYEQYRRLDIDAEEGEDDDE